MPDSAPNFDFDRVLERAGTHSTKWEKFGQDVLPMWVADMDFPAPQFVIDAIKERLEHPILGYTDKSPELVQAFMGWLRRHFNWQVEEDWLVWMPGVVPGLNMAAQTLTEGQLLLPTPVYHPFLDVGQNSGLAEVRVPMAVDAGRWSMDLEQMQHAVDRAGDVRMLLICNPQNPTGRCYTLEELEALAEFVLANDLLLVSDEIHCNILLDDQARHIPLATLSPELSARTVTLYSATKVYNIPGVSCAVAVVENPELRKRFLEARKGLVPGIGPLGFVASEVAFNDTSQWIPELNAYLRQNFAAVRQAVGDRLAIQDATYLAWLNVADLELDNAESYFAEHGLGINPGEMFGEPSHVRLNFGCPLATLEEGLRRFNAAVEARIS